MTRMLTPARIEEIGNKERGIPQAREIADLLDHIAAQDKAIAVLDRLVRQHLGMTHVGECPWCSWAESAAKALNEIRP